MSPVSLLLAALLQQHAPLDHLAAAGQAPVFLGESTCGCADAETCGDCACGGCAAPVRPPPDKQLMVVHGLRVVLPAAGLAWKAPIVDHLEEVSSLLQAGAEDGVGCCVKLEAESFSTVGPKDEADAEGNPLFTPDVLTGGKQLERIHAELARRGQTAYVMRSSISPAKLGVLLGQADSLLLIIVALSVGSLSATWSTGARCRRLRTKGLRQMPPRVVAVSLVLLGVAACDDGPMPRQRDGGARTDGGTPDADLRQDAAAEFLGSFDPRARASESFDREALVVRVRMWNMRGPDPRVGADVTLEQARRAFSMALDEVDLDTVNGFYSQCRPPETLHFSFESLGVLDGPADCIAPRTASAAARGGFLDRRYFLRDDHCAEFYFGSTTIPRGDADNTLGSRLNGDGPRYLNVFLVPFFTGTGPPEGETAANGADTVLVAAKLLRQGPQNFARVLAHEAGHALGGYPPGAPHASGGHAQHPSALCPEGVRPSERHLMCDSGAGDRLDQETCRFLWMTRDLPDRLTNFNEVCDGIDNDLDGNVDEAGGANDECAS